MLSIVVFILLLSSGSIFAGVYFNYRYEEIMPITAIGFVLIAYLLGIVNLLKYSFFVILVISIVLYGLAIYKIIKSKNIKQVLSNTFTPAFLIFVILCFVFILGTKGKLFDLNDDFSHWGDIVKVMVDIGDFGTNPNSGSLFKSYPPAMSLFQYLLERLNYYITGNIFIEWLCYYAYDILCVIVLLPLFSKVKFKNVTSIIAILATIFCIPCIYFDTSYLSLHIENFLAFLICAFALHMLFYDNSKLTIIRMLMMLSMFVITKDSGLLFGGLFAVGFIVLHLLTNNKETIKNRLIICISIIASVAIPKLLWELDIRINNVVRSFGNRFDFVSLINVLRGNEVSYRKEVFNNFIDEMVEGHITFGLTTKVPHFAIVGISIFVIIIVTALAKYLKQTNTKNVIATRTTLILISIVFIVGMCISYMYKFSEEEALFLASFLRYISTIYLSLTLFSLLALIIVVDEAVDKKEIYNSLIICLILFMTHFGFIVSFGFGTSAALSQQTRQGYYQEIVDKTNRNAQNSKIWFIEIEEGTEDRLVYKYCVRPNMVDGEYSIRTALGENDYFSIEMSVDEWKNELINGGYDYVTLFVIDDTFVEQYATMFENPEEIQGNSIYSINNATGLLSLCE